MNVPADHHAGCNNDSIDKHFQKKYIYRDKQRVLANRWQALFWMENVDGYATL